MSFQRFRTPTAENITYTGEYSQLSPVNIANVANQNKVLRNNAGTLQWYDLVDFRLYKGVHDASSSTIITTGALLGDLYIISVAGNNPLINLQVGDHIIFNGTTYDKMSSATVKTISEIRNPANEVTMSFSGAGMNKMTTHEHIFQTNEIRTNTIKNTGNETRLTFSGTGNQRLTLNEKCFQSEEIRCNRIRNQLTEDQIHVDTTGVGRYVLIDPNSQLRVGKLIPTSIMNSLLETYISFSGSGASRQSLFVANTEANTTAKNTVGGGNWDSTVVNYNQPDTYSRQIPRGIRNITTATQHGFQWSDGVNVVLGAHFGVSYSIKADGWCVINISVDITADPAKSGQTMRWYPPVPVSPVTPAFYNTPMIGTIFNGSQSHGIYLQLVSTYFKVVYANYHGGSHGDFTENLLETYDLTIRGSFEYPTNVCSFA
jgi:hypothetical protein